jgi:dTDP-4-amino-4,6-dideoxygalactose transaminase
MVTTNSEAMKDRIGRLRNHGVTRDPALMVDTKLSFDVDGQPNPWSYEQMELGFNYRMNEIEAALGSSQLAKLDYFVKRRSTLVSRYVELLKPLSPYVEVVNLGADEDVSFHIFTLRLTHPVLRARRSELMRTLIARGVGCQVHYIPLYRQPFFREKYGDLHLENAERYYSSTLTLPMYPRMTEDEVNWVVLELTSAISKLLSA